MSLKAIVAYKTSEGFDLYFSMNGADEFYLKPYLQEYLDGRYDKTLSRVDSRLPGGNRTDPTGFTDSHDEAVASKPIATDVPLENIGSHVDFLDIEGLYLVRDDTVETYGCVWLYPDVLRVLTDAVKLTVYDRSSFSLDRDEPLSDSAPIITHISRTDFSEYGFEIPELWQFIEENHQGICQNLRWVTNDVYLEDDLEDTWLVAEEVTKIRPQTAYPELPKQKGSGVFVRVDTDVDFAERGSRESVAEAGQSLRIEQSLALLSESNSVSSTRRLNAELEILAELIRIFGSRVATFSPQPYGEYVAQYTEKLGVDTTCIGLEYRLIDSSTTSVRLVEHESEDVPTRKTLQNLQQSSTVSRRVFDLPIDKLDEDGRTVLDRSVPGDILTVSITDDILTGVAFGHHAPLVIAEADVLPDIVKTQASKGDIRRRTSGDRVAGKRFVLQSPHEVLEREPIAVGECMIVYDGRDSLWDQFKSGEALESIIAGFTEFETTPVESIGINPSAVDYWYVCIFRFYRCGMAQHLRRQLDQPYKSVVEVLQEK